MSLAIDDKHPEVVELMPKLASGITTVEQVLLPLAEIVDPEDKTLVGAPGMMQQISNLKGVLECEQHKEINVPLHMFKANRTVGTLFFMILPFDVKKSLDKIATDRL